MICLVVEHAPHEHAAMLAQWLPAAGLGLTHCRPYAGDEVPTSAEQYDAVLVMGGPQSAYAAEQSLDKGIEAASRFDVHDADGPWRGERDLIRSAVSLGVPLLGICLGAQLLATACGGEVRPAAAGSELGVHRVSLLEAAAADPLLWGLPKNFEAVQWHYDEISELPLGATLLASSVACPVQAFKVGERAWGLQFHIEATAEVLAGWARADGLDPTRYQTGLDALDMPGTGAKIASAFAEVARSFLQGSPASVQDASTVRRI